MSNQNLVLFESEDHAISLPVTLDQETVWLNRNQIAELFDRDVKTIGKHIGNAMKEELAGVSATVAKFATVLFSETRRTSPLRVALLPYTRALQDRIFIPAWRKRQQICCTLSPRTTAFRMATSGLRLLCSFIFWTGTVRFSQAAKKESQTTRWWH